MQDFCFDFTVNKTLSYGIFPFCTCPSMTQVQIFNPAFFKYIHDHWTRHHGRYPSTGMLVLFFALHVCDEVCSSSFSLCVCINVALVSYVLFYDLLSSRWTCLVSVQTAVETGTTTGSRTATPENSGRPASTMQTTKPRSLRGWPKLAKSQSFLENNQQTILHISKV